MHFPFYSFESGLKIKTINDKLEKEVDKLEKEVVYPENPILYRRYVDDVFHHKKIREEDTLLPKLNAYHQKADFTVERELKKFLDTKLQKEQGKYKTSVSRNRKIPTH